jgi:hypothetical protein
MRTTSPWIDAWTFFLESLMTRTISLAFSLAMPWVSLIFWRTLLPVAGSISRRSAI